MFAQSAPKTPAFDIASIKPADAAAGNPSINRTGTRLTIAGYSPRMLIAWAYDVRDDRLIGESKWLDAARYDIVAKAPELPALGQLQLMMQSLLAERFGLVIHHETRNLSFYALTVDNGGPKIQLTDPGSAPGQNNFRMSKPNHLAGTNVTAAMLANVLSNQTGRSVQDFTGLKGVFDFTLAWAPDTDPQAPDTTSLPSIFTAVREQLGLKLEPRRGPVDVVVVDRIAGEPTGN